MNKAEEQGLIPGRVLPGVSGNEGEPLDSFPKALYNEYNEYGAKFQKNISKSASLAR